MDDDSSALPKRKWLEHEVPDHIPDSDPVFFLTVCCLERHQNQLATPEVWSHLAESITARNESGLWKCSLFLAMPDHIHGIVRFEGNQPMKKVIGDWKRWINHCAGISWQEGFFDHRLRDQANVIKKRRYILENPVRAGLVGKIADWPYVHDQFPLR